MSTFPTTTRGIRGAIMGRSYSSWPPTQLTEVQPTSGAKPAAEVVISRSGQTLTELTESDRRDACIREAHEQGQATLQSMRDVAAELRERELTEQAANARSFDSIRRLCRAR